MSVNIVIPTPMQRYADNREEIQAEGATVDAALASLTEQFPDLKKHLFTEDGKIRNFVNVYVNDDDSRYTGGGATAIKDGDTLTIVPSIAGGLDAVGHGGAPSFHLSVDPNSVELDSEEILRYSRHLIMPEVTMEGQKRLKAAKVLCVGTGGLGAPLTLYLAAAGVGTIGLVDFDVVDLTNLQRQIVHRQSSIGTPKIDSAERTLKELNPQVNIIKHETMLTKDNAMEILKDHPIDLLVVDTEMPEMDGYELVRWLRRSGLDPNAFAPVIMTATHVRRSRVTEARDCGANFVITKPFSAASLLERIVFVARDTRPFLEVGDYFGPDRRFREGHPPAEERRADVIRKRRHEAEQAAAAGAEAGE